MARVLADKGDSTGAQARYEQVIAADPQAAYAMVASGDLAEKDANYALAKQRFEQALKLTPNDLNLQFKLIDILVALGDAAGAEALTTAIRKADPLNGRLVVAEGDVAKARLEIVVIARDALQANPKRSASEESQLATLNRQIEELYQLGVSRYQARSRRVRASIQCQARRGLPSRRQALEAGELQAVIRSPYRATHTGTARVARGETARAIEQFRTALARSFELEQRVAWRKHHNSTRTPGPRCAWRILRGREEWVGSPRTVS
jgi:tetratricopeptide (TPR) repeat protein